MAEKSYPYDNGPWWVESERTGFENPWLRIIDSEVRQPDGSPGRYGVVHFKNLAIGILPLDEQGRTHLVGQHRFPLESYSWELPEGGGPLDIDPLVSAQRELAEETGFRAAQWTEFFGCDMSNSVTDERAVGYIATDLTPGEAAPEPTEVLAREVVAFSTLYDRVLNGDIRDSLTVMMVLTAHAKASRGDLPEPICELLLRS